jgi:hypothetical protein
MNRRLACVFLACLACVAAPRATTAPPDRPALTGDVDILVGGVPQRRYAHDGRWYVEALKGREYAIRVRNPYGVRVAVALTVDGLNTIDARHTSAAAARKWVIDPYDSITISGWQTSRSEARRFEFTTEEGSYAQALGYGTNLGVIAAAFFKERVPVRMNETTRDEQKRQSAPAAPTPSASDSAAGSRAGKAEKDDDYAATGMGRRTDHHVTQVRVDLEDRPSQTVLIRYEYRPQLVTLGILPPARATGPLQRRERASGFEPGFSPEPPRRR